MGTPARAALHVAVPTALHDDGRLDLDGQARLAAAAADAGAAGVAVLVGDEGVQDDERPRIVAASAGAGVPVLAGVGRPGPGQLPAARRAADAGADLLVVLVGREAGAGQALANVADLGVPLVVHHHPGRTGARWTSAEVAAFANEVDAAGVLLEAAPVPDRVAELVAAGVAIALGGLGGLFLIEELEAGCSATCAATAVPERLDAVLRRWAVGETGAAIEEHASTCRYLRLEAGTSGPTVRQEAWRQRGVLGSGRLREASPLGAATKAAVTRRLRELGVGLADPYPGA